MQNKIIVVGIGPGDEDFITPAALKKIRAAKFLIGGRRALSTFAHDGQITCPITRDLDAAIDFIRDKLPLDSVVVMVSGDPGYYSLLDLLRKNFPPSTIEVIPSISAIQLAFAKVSLPWHDATLLSFHGRQPAREALQFTAGKILGLLTDAENNSATISQRLIDCGWGNDSLVTICASLSYPDENIFTTTLAEAAKSEPVCHCVMIVRGTENFSGSTKNLVDDNISRLLELFPTCATEMLDDDGKIRLGVNFDALRQILSKRIVEGREAFVFNFVGKKHAALEAHTPIRKTLRPQRELSRDFDSTRNIYIEGDNLDALKLLQESYLHKVKLIYIDPPYNTGNDFIYRDDFRILADAFDNAAENRDDDGNRLRLNKSSEGRFHSDWCAMIYSRLLLAKNFLSDDGVIFISIDDHEQANLKKICDEVFGERNFVCNVIWEKKYSPQNDAKWLSDNHDLILIYARYKENWRPNLLPRTAEMDARYKNPDNDPRGVWKPSPLHAKSGTNTDEYIFPNGVKWTPPPGTFRRYSEETLINLYEDKRIYFGADGKSIPQFKRFLTDVRQGSVSKTIWFRDEVGDTHAAKTELHGLNVLFDTPKPTRLIEKILRLATDADSIVMDFFSGSATTAHAVMELNAQDGGHRRFIMVQLDEPTPENSEARRAGYETICDIGQERIRRAGDKLKINHPDIDAGFRVFKVDDSNFVEPPAIWTREILLDLVENIKPDRNAWDLLFGTLIECGLTIDKPVTHEVIAGFEVLIYGGEIFACFAANVSEELIHELAARHPRKIFFRDASFATSADKINAREYLSYFAPDSDIKVL